MSPHWSFQLAPHEPSHQTANHNNQDTLSEAYVSGCTVMSINLFTSLARVRSGLEKGQTNNWAVRYAWKISFFMPVTVKFLDFHQNINSSTVDLTPLRRRRTVYQMEKHSLYWGFYYRHGSALEGNHCIPLDKTHSPKHVPIHRNTHRSTHAHPRSLTHTQRKNEKEWLEKDYTNTDVILLEHTHSIAMFVMIWTAYGI